MDFEDGALMMQGKRCPMALCSDRQPMSTII